mgnify:CR=1 FL=1
MNNPLIESIMGYRIVVMKNAEPEAFTQAPVIELRLSKVGGAHVTNPEDLIMQIEDAVYKQELKDAQHETG